MPLNAIVVQRETITLTCIWLKLTTDIFICSKQEEAKLNQTNKQEQIKNTSSAEKKIGSSCWNLALAGS